MTANVIEFAGRNANRTKLLMRYTLRSPKSE